MSGFGWNFETATRNWAKTARTIVDFKKKHPELAHRFKLVRYEALNTHTVEELRDILSFLHLDLTVYNFEAALDMPVYGSSFMKEEGEELTWKPKKKKKEFNTNERWRSWGNFRHSRFNWMARKELESLGYESVGAGDTGPVWVFVHTLLDLRYAAIRFPGRFSRALREGVRAFLKSMQGKGRTKANLKR